MTANDRYTATDWALGTAAFTLAGLAVLSGIMLMRPFLSASLLEWGVLLICVPMAFQVRAALKRRRS